MGYTHYILSVETTEEKFKEFSAACKKLHDALPETTDTAGGYHSNDPLVIRGGMGEDAPVFNSQWVWFNGDGENGLDHETFVIRFGDMEDWNYCKTARKPYDLLVVACLLAAVQFMDYRFNSDGFTDYKGEKNVDDLLPGLNFYNQVMGTNLSEDDLWNIREEYRLRNN